MKDPTRNLDKIEPGDTVNVVLVYHQNAAPDFFEGVVLYTPCATGDSWHIRESREPGTTAMPGRLRYVQIFADITLLKKAE